MAEHAIAHTDHPERDYYIHQKQHYRLSHGDLFCGDYPASEWIDAALWQYFSLPLGLLPCRARPPRSGAAYSSPGSATQPGPLSPFSLRLSSPSSQPAGAEQSNESRNCAERQDKDDTGQDDQAELLIITPANAQNLALRLPDELYPAASSHCSPALHTRGSSPR